MAIEKAISNTLQYLIQKANSTFEEGKHYVVLAYEQALKEGYTPQDAKKLLLEKITAFSRATIYRQLPSESKRTYTSEEENLQNLQHVSNETITEDDETNEVDESLESLEEDEEDDYEEGEDHDDDGHNDDRMVNKPRSLSSFTQEITIDGYVVGLTNSDGSIYCWLCLIDEIYLNAYDPKEILPVMYSDKDFADHISIYHKVTYDDWKQYKQYMETDEPRLSSKTELKRRQEHEHKIMRTNLANEACRIMSALRFQKPYTKVLVCRYLYSLLPVSVISAKGYTVAAEKRDGSLCCMFCLVDELQYNPYSSNDKEKKEARKTMPAMYSDEDFAYHELKYHEPSKEMWEKYLPCLHYDKQAWKDSWHQKQDYDKMADDIRKWRVEHPELVNEAAK